MPSFVIFCQPRTGSYHLVSLLDSAPDIVCHGEAFRPPRIELKPEALAALGVRMEDVAVRNDDPAGFARRLQALSTPSAIVGFKLFLNHVLVHKGLRKAVLQEPSWRKVVLLRDPVQTYASRLRAEETGVWTLKTGGRKPDEELLNPPVRFDAASFAKHMKEHDKFLRLVEEAEALPGNPVLRIDYDDLVAGGALGAALRFIGSAAAPEALTSGMQRQYTGDVRAGFSNWPEFAEHLASRGMVLPAHHRASAD